LESVSKRESRFENTLEEASFLLLFLEGQKKEKNKDDSYYRSINYSPLTIRYSPFTTQFLQITIFKKQIIINDQYLNYWILEFI